MNGESLLDDAVFISLIAGAIGGIGTILAALITIENLKEDRIYNKQIREEDLTREFTNKLKTLISLYITDISSYYYAHYYCMPIRRTKTAPPKIVSNFWGAVQINSYLFYYKRLILLQSYKTYL